jgi:hypothetical protein
MVVDYKKNKWPVLRDKEGKKFKHLVFHAEGRPLYYSNDFTAPMKLAESTPFIILFQVPETSIPEKLDFIYYYRSKPKKMSSKKGEIEINLTVPP